jgi:catechol 2,3-dioxygenase-like lactoylglutathione lyase family enzyme
LALHRLPTFFDKLSVRNIHFAAKDLPQPALPHSEPVEGRRHWRSIMSMTLRRIILFTRRMPAMAAFYAGTLGLRQVTDEDGFKEFDAGGCKIALHNGASEVGARPPKIVFWSDDVPAAREVLVARGANVGKVLSGRGLVRCEGKDPDGNPFQISNRP